jgi:hypothetical protein
MFITFAYRLQEGLPRRQLQLRPRLQRQHRRLHQQLPSLQRLQQRQPQRLQLPQRPLLRRERHRGRAQLLILVRRRGEWCGVQLDRLNLARGR